MKRFAILVSVCLLLWVAGLNAQTQTQSGKPKIVVEQDTYDAGEIYKSADSLKHDFVIKNTGAADLQILSATPG